jgi:nucleoside-diphosphate-sugar epimerase
MKILIIGHKGFIGSRIVQLLKNEELCFFNRNLESNIYEPSDLIALLKNKFDFIIFASGSNNKNDGLIINSSILNLKIIINNYKYIQSTTFIFLSSNVVYYNNLYDDEYRRCKILSEELILSSLFENKIILRIPIIFETMNFKIIKMLSKLFYTNRYYNYFVHVEELIDKINCKIKDPKSEIVNFYSNPIFFNKLNKINFGLFKINLLIKILDKYNFMKLRNKFQLFVAYEKN